MTTNRKTIQKKASSPAKKRNPSVKKKKAIKKKSGPARPAAQKISTQEKPLKIEANKALTLNPVLVINNAKSLSQDLDKLVKSNKDINIDASAVEMIDTATLQLLLAATIKINSSNHKVNWNSPSDKFISSASLLGLSELLGIS